MEASIELRIAAECASGNWKNFQQIYDEYFSRIFRYVYYRVHHKQTTEDLTSTIFLKAIANMDQFKPGQLFGPWIYRIARNTLIDHSRTRKVTWDLDLAINVSSGDDVMAKTDSTLKVEVVREALIELSQIQREVVMMRVWDELTHKEIGEILGISEDNSKVAFSRAQASLRKLISKS